MIVDSSALVAIVFDEPGTGELLEKLDAAPVIGTGAPTAAETAIVLSARLGTDGHGLVRSLIAESDAVVLPFTDAHWRTAASAWRRFGKGRHPAALNFGDCLTYATARLADRPLLCVGNDFAETDLVLA